MTEIIGSFDETHRGPNGPHWLVADLLNTITDPAAHPDDVADAQAMLREFRGAATIEGGGLLGGVVARLDTMLPSVVITTRSNLEQ